MLGFFLSDRSIPNIYILKQTNKKHGSHLSAQAKNWKRKGLG